MSIKNIDFIGLLLVFMLGVSFSVVVIGIHAVYKIETNKKYCYSHGYHEAQTTGFFDHSIECIKYDGSGRVYTPLNELQQGELNND